MKPLVLIPCDNRMFGDVPMVVLYNRYFEAVRDQAGCLPLPLPATGAEDIDAYLALADGVMLTGSPANVHPSHFGQAVRDERLPLDPARDATTLPLIRRVVELGMPLLAICRGLQEINVALGGSLLQAVQEVPGRDDHRGAKGRPDASTPERYAPAHPVAPRAGGCLAGIIGAAPVMVNSVHGQGIDRLAPGTQAEAWAPDGQIEAISIAHHSGFALALQWHPEWQAGENEVSRQIFAAFGAACRNWRERRGANGAGTSARALATA